MVIKRFKYEYYPEAPHDSGMEEDENGSYVRYDDIKELIEKKRIDELHTDAENFEAFLTFSGLSNEPKEIKDKLYLAYTSGK